MYNLQEKKKQQWLRINKKMLSQAPMAQEYNPFYLGGWDWENCALRPALTNNFWEYISKIIREKWTGWVAQVVESLPCKHEALSSNSSPPKKKLLNFSKDKKEIIKVQ
jgi:hypothetical protein